jgi:hypothetical protein
LSSGFPNGTQTALGRGVDGAVDDRRRPVHLGFPAVAPPFATGVGVHRSVPSATSSAATTELSRRGVATITRPSTTTGDCTGVASSNRQATSTPAVGPLASAFHPRFCDPYP